MMHRAKKSLGQNFLKSQSALEKIAEAGELSPADTVLEIGPGLGALTERLLERAGKVIAVEKDRELFAMLSEKFAPQITANKLLLLEGDILDFDPAKYPETAEKYKIVANIPYNITGAILKKFLTAEKQPNRMVLLVQKEVADRIMARDGKESILSISVKAYGAPKIEGKIPAGSFSPAPKVDSAIIIIGNISRKFFTEKKIGEEAFWRLIRLSFAHKRKKLAGNLRGKDSDFPLIPKEFRDKRAEDLSLSDWTRFFHQKS